MTKKEVQFETRPAPKKETTPSKEQWVRAGRAGQTKRFTFDVPAELHSAFKSHCALSGANMQEKLIAFIEAEIAGLARRRGGDTDH